MMILITMWMWWGMFHSTNGSCDLGGPNSHQILPPQAGWQPFVWHMVFVCVCVVKDEVFGCKDTGHNSQENKHKNSHENTFYPSNFVVTTIFSFIKNDSAMQIVM